MKKSYWFISLVATLLIGTLVYTPVEATDWRDDDFNRNLAALLDSQDSSHYFDAIELTIGSSTMTVDGVEQELDVAPEIQNERTMLPIRAVAEAVGATVDYLPDTQTVLITGPYGDLITCPIGENTMTINSENYGLDVTTYAKNGRTYLPVRAVSEALNLTVDWTQATSTVSITAPYQSARLLAIADKLDTRGLNAETILNNGDGLWVLQFSSPAEAKVAEALLQADGISVAPDCYIPPIREAVSFPLPTRNSHYTWGAEDCHFDSFMSKYGELLKSQGQGVVAVVDTGADSNHPFLQGRILSGYDFVDGDYDPSDPQGHGTHVSGTIIDCVGTADVSILPVRVLDASGSGFDSTVAAGIRYAASHGANVINLSLGGTGHAEVIDDAIAYASGNGTVTVISAGNDNSDTAWYCPAHTTMPGTIVVSAGNQNHDKAYFSNYGSSIDVMAPGVNITASVPGGSYETWDGTSMAAPHVSAAAVLLDMAWGKSLPAGALEEKVHSATTYGRWTNSHVGYGFLDLLHADVPYEGLTTPEIMVSKSEISLKINETATLIAYTEPQNLDVTWSSSNSSIAAVSSVGTITAVRSGTTVITATMIYDNLSYSATCTVTVTPTHTTEPSGYSISANRPVVEMGEIVRITVAPYEACDTVILYCVGPAGDTYSFDISSCTTETNSYYKDVYSYDLGIWTFYATVTNEDGSYYGAGTDSYCEVAVTGQSNHTHTRGEFIRFDVEHPHINYYQCVTCGEIFSDGTTSYVDTCKICNPPHEQYWGAWSDWSSEFVASSDTREVETRIIKVGDAHIEYRYGRFVDSARRHDCWCATYLESMHDVSGKAILEYTDWNSVPALRTKTGWTCGYCKGNHVGVDKVTADGRSWWADFILPEGRYYWEETRTVPEVYQTQYRYRDLMMS